MDFGFFPSSLKSPQTLDSKMREALAESLAHVHVAASTQIGCTDLDIAALLSEIKTHRVRPGVFGRYYDLVFAVRNRQYSEAGTLFGEIAELARDQPALTVIPFTENALGADKARFARLIGETAATPTFLATPDSGQWFGVEDKIAAALIAIEKADPSLASELRATVIQIIGTAPSMERGAIGFAGASSFMLWGALFLNIVRYGTPLDLFEGLVHEAAHHLLFGLSVDEPLTENPADELYKSPLRTDHRPMDGIFHATFVCARICYAYERLRETGGNTIDDADEALIETRLQDRERRFFGGLETVERFGQLTPTGKRVMEAAADYMQRAS